MTARWWLNALLWCGLMPCALTGCVTVYQPLVGLQRPLAITPSPTQFKGLKLRLNCLPGDLVENDDAQQLCRQVSKLFTGQGAVVQTRTRLGGSTDDVGDSGKRGSAAKAPKADVDLEVDLTARELHRDTGGLLWTLCLFTGTLIPAISEYTFAQDIVVRGGDGFLLASDSWEGRFVQYFGVAIWAVNFLLDHTFRKPADQLTGEAADRDFSHDYYGQLTQLVFDAKSRWVLLHSNAAAGSP